MGLNFSHSEAYWSYSGFHRFRERLAREIDINLDEMQGFGGDGFWWSVRDPVVALLYHSDCDGVLTIEECRRIAPRLRELVSEWKGLDGFDRYQAELLAEGMELAASRDELLEFG